jgi:lysophospholipase L1-like esterase
MRDIDMIKKRVLFSGVLLSTLLGVWQTVGTADDVQNRQVPIHSADSVEFGRWQEDIDRWAEAIQRFEHIDRTEKDPENAIMFVGSSSIRLWKTLQQDMAPYPVIQRGYGGAKYSDLAYYADRIILPHRFRALVLFVGNDISGKETDKTPKEVAAYFQHVVRVVRHERPEVPIFCIDVRPTISRWHVWEQTAAGNRALQQVCEADPNLHFVSTPDLFMTKDGVVRKDLFVEDQLHLNRAGYRVWSARIRQELQKVVPPPPDQ